jgi:pimeloyl-ACP methyl ester carboxylesterase
MVDVGGGEALHVHCAGAGAPTVVFEECLGCTGTDYRAVQNATAQFTRACTFDHAGAGYSSAAPKPQLTRQLIGDLHKLLGGGAGDAGRVVLVGHGLGGLVTQIYARDFPNAVAGVVLVDAQTKDHDARYYAAFPPEALAKAKEMFSQSPENLEMDDQFRAMADLRAAPLSLGDRPLVVVSRGKSQPPPPWGIPDDSWEKLEALFRSMQTELPSLSRNSAQIVAADARWIFGEAPDTIATAAWEVVSSVRSGVPLNRLGATTPPTSSASAGAPKPAMAARSQVDDGLIDVGGRSLHLHCVGHGAPTVLMEAGRGESGATWDHVQPEVAKVTRACVYDRAGLGFSDAAAAPRAVKDVIQDLHALLGAGAMQGPYVLVGHSIGALYVRLYASAHPDQVAGMVLVDGTTEDTDLKLWTLSTPAEVKMMDDPTDPEGLRFDTLRAGMAQLREANRSIGDKPLVVLTAGLSEEPEPELGVSPELSARRAKIWAEMQAELPRRISSNGAQVVAAKAHHYIQLENPKLVVAAVEQVVDAARKKGRVDGSALTGLANEGAP